MEGSRVNRIRMLKTACGVCTSALSTIPATLISQPLAAMAMVTPTLRSQAEVALPPSATPHTLCPIAVTVSAYAQPAPAPAPSSRFFNLARWRSGGAAVVAWFRLSPTPTASPAHPAMARPSRKLAVRAQGPRPGTGAPRVRVLKCRAPERPPCGSPAGQVVYVWTCQSNCSMYCT